MKKYTHELTKDLTPDNWREKLNLDDLTVDDLIELLKDMRSMENFGKKLGGFLKEVIKARCKDMEEYDGRKIYALFTESFREGNLDMEVILEEMGEEWVESHRKDGTDFITIKLTEKEQE
jgi:hypothetical protein